MKKPKLWKMEDLGSEDIIILPHPKYPDYYLDNLELRLVEDLNIYSASEFIFFGVVMSPWW